MQDNIVIQELDDYIRDNGDRKDTLVMRVLKHNMVTCIQIQQDMGEVAGHIKECKESPSILHRFKAHPLKVIAELITISFCLFMIYYTIATVVGLREILISAIP